MFVCQPSESIGPSVLDISSSLLASSIRAFHPAQEVTLIACVPRISGEVGAVSPLVQQLFSELAVHLVEIDSPFGEEYLIGNKLTAIGVKSRSDKILFLDSDMLCLSRINLGLFSRHDVLVKPADFNTYGASEAQWKCIYQKFNLSLPIERVFTTVDQQYIPPYFNAGAVAVAQGSEFSQAWLNVAKVIDDDVSITDKRPWLDQIALPVAMSQLGMQAFLLGESYNYPAHVRALTSRSLPVLCHYHWPHIIREESVLLACLQKLARQYEPLRTLLRSADNWQNLLIGLSVKQAKQRPFFRVKKTMSTIEPVPDSRHWLITGMPRSGTSLLCNLLHKVDNVVVVNEPAEVFPALETDDVGRSLGLMFRQLRSKITQGELIENKIDEQGNVIEDTRHNDVRRKYLPEVTSSDFILAIKNPLAMMARLPQLTRDFDASPIVVNIRHPYDTILSWTASFDHLKEVDFTRFPFGGDRDPFVSEWQKEQLTRIRRADCSITRRALLWRYFAQLIWFQRHKVNIVRYEDLTREPARIMAELLRDFSDFSAPARIGDGVVFQSKHEKLSEHERHIVGNVCRDVAMLFGYDL